MALYIIGYHQMSFNVTKELYDLTYNTGHDAMNPVVLAIPVGPAWSLPVPAREQARQARHMPRPPGLPVLPLVHHDSSRPCPALLGEYLDHNIGKH